MRNHFVSFFAAVIVLASSQTLAAQEYQPRSITFKGAPEYSDQELLAAAGLKPGISLTVQAMKDHAQTLMDSGVFDSITFQFTGVDLRYVVKPSTALLPIRLANLPLTAGKDLDAKIHDRLPLYHGKVPSDGGITDQVRAALEEVLAAQGLKATVEAVASSDPAHGKPPAVTFTIVSPQVVVGEVRLDAKSPALEPGAREILGKIAGSPYDLEGSPSQIATYLGNYYHDKGYLEALIDAVPQGAPTASEDSIRIPFQVSFTLGIQYKLLRVQLAPDLPVTQAEFDHQANIHPGDIADGQRVIRNWEFISRQFHNHGFMKASVHPAPTFDHANGTVSFFVTAEPGPVYTMGKLTVQNVSEDLRAAMLSAWKMPAGATFNEGAILAYYAIGPANPSLARVFASANCKYTLTLNDAERTVDVVLRLEKRP